MRDPPGNRTQPTGFADQLTQARAAGLMHLETYHYLGFEPSPPTFHVGVPPSTLVVDPAFRRS